MKRQNLILNESAQRQNIFSNLIQILNQFETATPGIFDASTLATLITQATIVVNKQRALEDEVFLAVNKPYTVAVFDSTVKYINKVSLPQSEDLAYIKAYYLSLLAEIETEITADALLAQFVSDENTSQNEFFDKSAGYITAETDALAAVTATIAALEIINTVITITAIDTDFGDVVVPTPTDLLVFSFSATGLSGPVNIAKGLADAAMLKIMDGILEVDTLDVAPDAEGNITDYQVTARFTPTSNGAKDMSLILTATGADTKTQILLGAGIP